MIQRVDETSLIQRFLAPLASDGALGFRDDAASLMPTPDHELVLTSDAIVEGVHFLSSDAPADIAAKAIAVNLSDLVGKGAKPLGYLVSITFSQAPDEAWMADFARGLSRRAHGLILGGDMTRGGNKLTVSVTAIGEVPRGRMVRRKGAKPGDAIFLTGPIGTKTIGLKLALEPDWHAGLLSKDEVKALVDEYTVPPVPFADIYARLIRDHASASMDISDGLALDLNRLCHTSSVGAQIALADIPIHKAVKKLIDKRGFSLEEAITGGDDYVALFTTPQAKADQVGKAGGIARLHKIGVITRESEGVQFLDRDGLPMAISPKQGYDHFS